MTTSVRDLLLCTSFAALAACSTGADDMGDPADISDEGSSGAEAPADTDGLTTGVTANPTGDEPEGETEAGETGEGDTDEPVGTETGEVGETDGEETGETGEVLPEAPEDGDNPTDPAVYVQFRATSPGPLSFDAPIFNEEPIDTQGAQYSEALSIPGDDLDVIHFRIVPGQVDPYVHIELECDAAEQNRLRANLRDAEGFLIDTIVCGEGEVDVLLDGASSTDVYQVQVEIAVGDPLLAGYTLSVNGFCFQQCDFSPYMP